MPMQTFQSKDYANALRTYEQIISMQSDGGKRLRRYLSKGRPGCMGVEGNVKNH